MYTMMHSSLGLGVSASSYVNVCVCVRACTQWCTPPWAWLHVIMQFCGLYAHVHVQVHDHIITCLRMSAYK